MGKSNIEKNQTVLCKYPVAYSLYINEALESMRDDCLKGGPPVEIKLTRIDQKVELSICVEGVHDILPSTIGIGFISYVDGFLAGKGFDIENSKG